MLRLLIHCEVGFVIDGLYLRAIYQLNKQNMRKQQLRPYLDQRFGRCAQRVKLPPVLYLNGLPQVLPRGVY